MNVVCNDVNGIREHCTNRGTIVVDVILTAQSWRNKSNPENLLALNDTEWRTCAHFPQESLAQVCALYIQQSRGFDYYQKSMLKPTLVNKDF